MQTENKNGFGIYLNYIDGSPFVAHTNNAEGRG